MGGQNCIFHLHHLCVSDNLPPRELFQFPCAQHVSGIPPSRDFVSHEPIYVVSGEEVGRGSDNEPLLKNIEIIEELPFDYFNYGPSYEKYMPKEK